MQHIAKKNTIHNDTWNVFDMQLIIPILKDLPTSVEGGHHPWKWPPMPTHTMS